MKIAAIGGAPATGKTTLVRALINKRFGGLCEDRFEFGKLRGHHFKNNGKSLFLLGVYEEGEVFAGTDRLSMAVMPDAIKFLEDMKGKDILVLFEGDRLFSAKFIKACEENSVHTRAFYLTASATTKDQRCSERGSKQNESWRRGRETKSHSAAVTAKDHVVAAHETPGDTELVASLIDGYLFDDVAS